MEGQFKESVGNEACTPCAAGDTTPLPGSTNSTACVVIVLSCKATIATGGSNTCAITSVGSLKCWGLNNYGELGIGTSSAIGTSPLHMGASPPPRMSDFVVP